MASTEPVKMVCPDIVRETPFCTADADALFSRISCEQGNSFCNDYSLMTALRMVIYPVLDEDESYTVVTKDLRYPCKKPTSERVLKELGISNDDDVNNTLTVISLRSNGDNIDRETGKILPTYSEPWFRLLFNSVLKHKQEAGWQTVGTVNTMTTDFHIWCVTNVKKHSTIIVAEELNPCWVHALSMVTPMYFSWIPQEKYDDTWKRYGRAMLTENLNEFNLLVAEQAAKYDFSTIRVKRLLEGFEKRMTERELRAINDQIQRDDNDFNSLQNEIKKVLEKRSEHLIRKMGLEAQLEEGKGDSAIMQYFLSNKNVHLENTEDAKMTFVVTGYLNNWDKSLARRALDSSGSLFYAYTHGNVGREDAKRFAKAIFIDQSYKLRICAAYSVAIGSDVRAISGYRFGSEYETYAPNQHIQHNACTGGYRTTLNEMARDGNWCGAIDLCMASAYSLALNDPSAQTQMNWIYEHMDKPIIETKDGEIISVSECIKRLKEEG